MEPHDHNDPAGIPAPPTGEAAGSPVPSVPGLAPDPGAPVATDPGPAPQLWLTPGPYLPRRDWQRRTRSLVTAATSVGGALWLLGVLAVIIVGIVVGAVLKHATFTGHGGVIVNCSTRSTDGGAVLQGTPVQAWTDKSEKVLYTELEKVKVVEVADPKHHGQRTSRCHLPFKLEGVRRDAAGYNLRIGDSAPQFITTKALKEGAFVPVVPGGER
ncbi:hypothetical protein [Gordonia sp. (in: high G+C Gram-positive bacteria)]|uniref:hypothetical protein n=1 Tax=Gordonia sp. (in: high G+C Gram-positive bacteria) TaxID=84139 RepID=UPI0039E33464